MIASRKRKSILTALGLAENLMNIEKDNYRNGAKVAMSYPVVEVPSTVELTA